MEIMDDDVNIIPVAKDCDNINDDDWSLPQVTSLPGQQHPN